MASQTRRTSSRGEYGHRQTSRTIPKAKNGAAASSTSTPASPSISKPNPNPDKQAEIFSAALHLFQEKGYHGTSMQDLADAVGMQKASLYYYIRSKEELLTLVCEHGTGAFTQELKEIVESEARGRR